MVAVDVVLTGAPLKEPVFGYGPFVMTSEAEIRQAAKELVAERRAAKKKK